MQNPEYRVRISQGVDKEKKTKTMWFSQYAHTALSYCYSLHVTAL